MRNEPAPPKSLLCTAAPIFRAPFCAAAPQSWATGRRKRLNGSSAAYSSGRLGSKIRPSKKASGGMSIALQTLGAQFNAAITDLYNLRLRSSIHDLW